MVSKRVMVSHRSLMLGRVWWLPTRTNWFLHEKIKTPNLYSSFEFWLQWELWILYFNIGESQHQTNGTEGGNHAPELPLTQPAALIALTIIPESNVIVPTTMPLLAISLNCMYMFLCLDCWVLLTLILYIVGLFTINAVPLLDIWFEWSLSKWHWGSIWCLYHCIQVGSLKPTLQIYVPCLGRFHLLRAS